ncbi:hypothetical protein LXA43DRAFT_896682, partial [Ganoderma leucocontextum]
QAERAGVHHLVHAWPAQGHPYGPLFVSHDALRGATAHQAVSRWFRSTNPFAVFLAELFKVAFPDYYIRFQHAFDAGVWFEGDPGPWLGRAIVWKLDVGIHYDMNDGGPAACIPMGSFVGGEMAIPRLHARFRYVAGDVIIGFFGALAHLLYPSSAPPGKSQLNYGLTPGRISSVFFFPARSLLRLKDQPPLAFSKGLVGKKPLTPEERAALAAYQADDVD